MSSTPLWHFRLTPFFSDLPGTAVCQLSIAGELRQFWILTPPSPKPLRGSRFSADPHCRGLLSTVRLSQASSPASRWHLGANNSGRCRLGIALLTVRNCSVTSMTRGPQALVALGLLQWRSCSGGGGSHLNSSSGDYAGRLRPTGLRSSPALAPAALQGPAYHFLLRVTIKPGAIPGSTDPAFGWPRHKRLRHLGLGWRPIGAESTAAGSSSGVAAGLCAFRTDFPHPSAVRPHSAIPGNLAVCRCRSACHFRGSQDLLTAGPDRRSYPGDKATKGQAASSGTGQLGPFQR